MQIDLRQRSSFLWFSSWSAVASIKGDSEGRQSIRTGKQRACKWKTLRLGQFTEREKTAKAGTESSGRRFPGKKRGWMQERGMREIAHHLRQGTWDRSHEFQWWHNREKIDKILPVFFHRFPWQHNRCKKYLSVRPPKTQILSASGLGEDWVTWVGSLTIERLSQSIIARWPCRYLIRMD